MGIIETSIGKLDVRWLLQHVNSPLIILCITGLFYGLFIIAVAGKQQFGIVSFIRIGDYFSNKEELYPEVRPAVESRYGYEGQFYYRLALDPFTATQKDFGVTIDNLPYRQQRIMYPLLVWILSFGNHALVPSLMVGVNYAGLMVLSLLGGYYATLFGRHYAWGALFSFYPGYLFTLTHNLTEITLACFILGTFIMMRREQYAFAAVFLIAGLFTKEAALLLVVSLAVPVFSSLNAARRAFYHKKIITLLVVSLSIFFLWHLYLFLQWRVVFPYAYESNIGLPFQGIMRFLQNNPINWHMIEFAFLIIVFITTVIALVSSKVKDYVQCSAMVAWLLYTALLVFLTYAVWKSDGAFMRVAGLWTLLSYALLLSSTTMRKWLPLIGLMQIILWFYTAIFFVA